MSPKSFHTLYPAVLNSRKVLLLSYVCSIGFFVFVLFFFTFFYVSQEIKPAVTSKSAIQRLQVALTSLTLMERVGCHLSKSSVT